jgi:phosphoserine phosphatase
VDDPPRSRALSDGRTLTVPDGLAASLVLLRHGESTAIVEGRFQGRLDTPLSPLGERQAELAGIRLAGPADPPRIPVPDIPPIEIRHSPLDRTRATAQAVADALGLIHGPSAVPTLMPDAGLLELAQGDWEGLHRTEVYRRFPAELEAWRLNPISAVAPGGESLQEASARVERTLAAVLDGLAAAAPGSGPDGASSGGYPEVHGRNTPWTLLVAHDGIFKVTLLTILGLPLDRFWTFPWGLTGISVVEFVGGRPILRAHNLTDHLGPLQAEDDAPGAAARSAELRSEAEAAERERTGSL